MTSNRAAGADGWQITVMASDVVRDTIARTVLQCTANDCLSVPHRLGPIRLRPHQIDAAARVARLLAESGGALLADEVGLGKTYVALALARGAARPLVVAPAALLPMWQSAVERVRVDATLVSFERLSRAGSRGTVPVPAEPDLVIVDEAHHVRTPTTRRYSALARLCARSRVLLLSATPLQNTRRDLAAQIALFLGSAAWAMSDAELARHIVRRTREDVRIEQSPPPTVSPAEWIELGETDDCLDALLALPPPVPSSDGGDGGALLVYSLVRQWASSRAALRTTLRRRLARAVALTAALEAGRYPSRAEIAAWIYADGSVQLAFPELVAPRGEDAAGVDRERTANALLAAVRKHGEAVRNVLRALDRHPDPDLVRAAAIRAIRSRHPHERIIAFAESAETIEALFRLLRGEGRVAMLRARGAAVSGGALSRQEALARFAPVAQGAREPHASERIDLLLATDLLSEGVNLQDASVVIHVDLPWNPARLEQRVGRVSRLGSAHARVSVYAMRPPIAAERLLAVERRLRDKLAAAGRAVGVVGAILPGLDPAAASERGSARDVTHVHALLSGWQNAGRPRAPEPRRDDLARPAVAAVAATSGGFLAAVVDGGRPMLIAQIAGASPSTAPAIVARAVELASGADAPVDDRSLRDAMETIDRWLARRAADQLAGIETGSVARARRHLLARITSVASRAPRHLRSVVTPLAADARRVALMPLAEGAERVLAELADAPLADQAWLRALGAFGELHKRPRSGGTAVQNRDRLVALLLLEPDARAET